jgi:hypothetical protein
MLFEYVTSEWTILPKSHLSEVVQHQDAYQVGRGRAMVDWRCGSRFGALGHKEGGDARTNRFVVRARRSNALALWSLYDQRSVWIMHHFA